MKPVAFLVALLGAGCASTNYASYSTHALQAERIAIVNQINQKLAMRAFQPPPPSPTYGPNQSLGGSISAMGDGLLSMSQSMDGLVVSALYEQLTAIDQELLRRQQPHEDASLTTP